MMPYCLDTSALIEIWLRYPPDVFETVWANMQVLIDDDELMAPEEVKLELLRQEDGLGEWISDNDKMFHEESDETQEQLRIIIKRFKSWINPQSEKNKGDAHVVAHAFVKQKTVIGNENPSNNLNGPKLPDVCTYYDVEYFKPLEFFRAENWKI